MISPTRNMNYENKKIRFITLSKRSKKFVAYIISRSDGNAMIFWPNKDIS